MGLPDDARGSAVLDTTARTSWPRSDARGTAMATLIVGSGLTAAVVLALRSTVAVRRSGEADWRTLAILAALLTVVVLSAVIAARA